MWKITCSCIVKSFFLNMYLFNPSGNGEVYLWGAMNRDPSKPIEIGSKISKISCGGSFVTLLTGIYLNIEPVLTLKQQRQEKYIQCYVFLQVNLFNQRN